MRKITLILLSFSISLVLFSQSQSVTLDENGFTERSISNHNYLEMLHQQKSANGWNLIGPYGGDVMDIAVYPLNTDIVFAAAGVPYKSIVGGQTWTYMESLLNLAPNGVQVIEASPDGTIYAAGLYVFHKIFRSEDGGETWVQKTIPVNSYGLDIKVDPNDPNVVYVALASVSGSSSNNVIVKSEDGGDSWSSYNLISVLPVGWSVVNLEVDPEDSQVIFAIGNEGINNAAVVATFDGGATWEDRTGNLPVGIPYNRLTISEGDVYIAGGQLFGGQIMGVYKTVDYGQNWLNISSSFPNKVSNAILIDPDNTDKMYVATEGDGVYYTENGGTDWNYNTSGAGDKGSSRCLVFEPGNNDVIYAGFLSLAVCKSVDAAQSWEFESFGIATLQTDDIEVNPNDPLTFLVGFEAENSGGCYLTNDGGQSWQIAEGLPATRFSQVTFGADETMYAWSNGPTSIAQEGLYKSTDGGQTWENTGPFVGSAFETQIFSLVASETDPNLIFIGGNNFGNNGWASIIYSTTDAGENWENVYMGPEYDSFKYLFIDPNSNDDIIYSAFANQTEHAGFMVSYDKGDAWLSLNSGIPGVNKWGGAIVSDPLNSDILYGGVGGYGGLNGTIYKSENGGGLWSPTSLSLNIYSKINDILISPLNSDIIYTASSQDGVYVSFDAGENWEAASDGLPSAYVTGFSNAFVVNELWYFAASTFSGSTYTTEVADQATYIQTTRGENDVYTIFPNPSGGEINIQLTDVNRQIESLTIYTVQGKLVKYFDSSDFSDKVTKIETGLSPNIYMCKVVCEGKVYSSKLVIVE